MEKGSLLKDNLPLSAFWKNIPGDRKEFPVWVERVAAPGVTSSSKTIQKEVGNYINIDYNSYSYPYYAKSTT